MNKIALITGTSTGLGISLAVQLAEKGFKAASPVACYNPGQGYNIVIA